MLTPEVVKKYVVPRIEHHHETEIIPKRRYKRADLQRLANRWYGIKSKRERYFITLKSRQVVIKTARPNENALSLWDESVEIASMPFHVDTYTIPPFMLTAETNPASMSRAFRAEIEYQLELQFYDELFRALERQ